MDMLLIAAVIVVLCFGYVVLFGAPYVPTLARQSEEAFDMLGLQKGDTLLELGSGDGRFLAAAAKKGIHTVGYELNPLLVLWTKLRYWKYRKLISVKWRNFWSAEWPKSDGIYVFLLDKYMKKLDTKVVQYLDMNDTVKELKLVSYTFTIPGKSAERSSQGLHLYIYHKSTTSTY